ncbi:hypothetical protein [Denitrobacterium detoxificans]|uniref:hypothetical protein n=1 Tax=Denitrobacterium detoxificans TaxID=79604 RepID=UPI0026F0F7E4|nr:hypothetical protein [Denitrobacterium detoxificans]MBE6466007.1 hypothetical protein [Denitrobacterium detoxificans]
MDEMTKAIESGGEQRPNTTRAFLGQYSATSIPNTPIERFFPKTGISKLRYYGVESAHDLANVPIDIIVEASKTSPSLVLEAERWLVTNLNLHHKPYKTPHKFDGAKKCSEKASSTPISSITTPGIASKLSEAGFVYVSDLAGSSIEDILAIKGMGSGRLKKMESAAATLGLTLTFKSITDDSTSQATCAEQRSFRKMMWESMLRHGCTHDNLVESLISDYPCERTAFTINVPDGKTAFIPLDLTNSKSNICSLIRYQKGPLLKTTEQAYSILQSLSKGGRESITEIRPTGKPLELALESLCTSSIGAVAAKLGMASASTLLIELINALNRLGYTNLLPQKAKCLANRCPDWIRDVPLSVFDFLSIPNECNTITQAKTVQDLSNYTENNPLLYCIYEEIIDYADICYRAYSKLNSIHQAVADIISDSSSKPNQRQVDLASRYYTQKGLGVTLNSLGSEYGISRERVRQIIKTCPTQDEISCNIVFTTLRIAVYSQLLRTNGFLSYEALEALLATYGFNSNIHLEQFLTLDAGTTYRQSNQTIVLAKHPCASCPKADSLCKTARKDRTSICRTDFSNICKCKSCPTHENLSFQVIAATNHAGYEKGQLILCYSEDAKQHPAYLTTIEDLSMAAPPLPPTAVPQVFTCSNSAYRYMTEADIPIVHINAIYKQNENDLTAQGITNREYLYQLIKLADSRLSLNAYPWVTIKLKTNCKTFVEFLKTKMANNHGYLPYKEVKQLAKTAGLTEDYESKLVLSPYLLLCIDRWYYLPDFALANKDQLVSLVNSSTKNVKNGRMISARDLYKLCTKDYLDLGIRTDKQLFNALKSIGPTNAFRAKHYPYLLITRK